MENLDPLRQKPDFEKIAKEQYAIVDLDGNEAGNRQPWAIRHGFAKGCEHVWTSHVEPLMKENEVLESVNILWEQTVKENESRIRELEEENKKLKWTA